MIPSHPARAKPDIVMAVALGGSALAVYVKTLAPTLLMADAAEFQFASYLLGIAHPTGYPLYLMLGWLWSHLFPLGDAAFRINLLSAVCAALAIGLLYALILEVLRSTLPAVRTSLLRATAAISTLTMAFSRTFWSQAVKAEVYALNSLFVVVILFLLLRWSRSDSHSQRTLYLTAFFYGLSLTHHRTMLLFLPAFALFVWLVHRPTLSNVQSLCTMLVLILFPQILYLYIPLRASATPYLHIELAPDRTLELYTNTLRGFQDFVMGQMFRGELGYQAPIAERLAMVARFLLNQFGAAGLFMGLLGVLRLGIGRWKVLVLLGLSYLALVAFNLFYFIGDIHVLFTPTYIISTIWIAVGVGWLLEVAGHLAKRWPRAGSVVCYGIVALFALLPLSQVWNNYPRVDKSGDYEARQWAEGVLSQPLPEGAILISNDRNEITPLIYLQYVEGIRPDVLTMFPLLLPGDEYSNVVRVIDGVIDLERPIYLVKPMPGLEIKYQMEPFDSLVEVKGPAITGEPEYPTDLPLDYSLLLIGYDLEADTPSQGAALRVALYWEVAEGLGEDYHSYIHLVDEQGNVVAQSDHQPGGAFYPTSVWQREEIILDAHVIPVPARSAGHTLQLLTGMYGYPSLEPHGERLLFGRTRIKG
ncbi:MAG: DUF2723 domain-containing protein [Anaerolineae bacterium]|nr:DUF2723 domain-containing protein [Anaerolineae bacterium]NIN95410.1 DUF2723 domain-containing protein [Anaerolineae bacterium]NIQ78391.1 DUF2723 domain-containing protein [Anaerolineae bacterium]